MTVNDFGKTFLVEECDRIDMSHLLREYKKQLLKADINAMGVSVRLTTSKTGNGGTRFWFVCPSCGKRVGTLFRHNLQNVLGCRQCLNLDYKKHRFGGMPESKFA